MPYPSTPNVKYPAHVAYYQHDRESIEHAIATLEEALDRLPRVPFASVVFPNSGNGLWYRIPRHLTVEKGDYVTVKEGMMVGEIGWVKHVVLDRPSLPYIYDIHRVVTP